MKKFDLPLILDIIFIFFASLFVSFTLLRFYLDNLAFVIIISFLVSFICAFTGYKLLLGKHKNIFLKNEEVAKKNEVFFNLAFFCENDIKKFLLKLFLKAEIKAENTKSGIFLTDKKLLVRYMFKLTPINCDDFVKTVKNNDDKDVLLISDNILSEVYSYAKKVNIKLLSGTELFLLMKKYETYPDIKYSLKANEKIIKRHFNVEFTRKKAKNFLLFGGVLLLFSMFVAFPIYYLVMGNLFIIASVILRFYGKKPENNDPII